MTKNTLLLPLIFMALSCCACNSGGNTEGGATTTSIDSQANSAPKPNYDAALPKGKVADSIMCRKDGSQIYALYLPNNYTAAAAWPCILFFDAHARGTMPVSMYKAIAEKYGYVLVASDVSKNGIPWEITEAGIKTLIEDVRTRMNIDAKRIYAAGFSGGARVATSLALFDGGVAGVIGCAAGFPQGGQGGQHKFYYFGIVGDYDFNHNEMAQLDESLAQSNWQHQLLTTSSIHGWASAADFETGVLWLQANAMKEHLQPKTDSIVSALKKDLDARIAAATKTKDWLTAYRLTDGAARVFDGLTDATTYKQQAAAIAADTTYKKALALQAQLQQEEMNGQQDLQQEFASQNEQWWRGKISAMNTDIKNAKTPQQAQMAQRLLNFLGFVSYMYSERALKGGDLTNADAYISTFKLADPKNSDVAYLRAQWYMQKNDDTHALASLQDAAKLGYSDVAQLLSDPVFATLHGDAAFKNVVSMAKENVIK